MIDHPKFGDSALTDLAGRVGERLAARGARVTTAESCTGGWIAKCLTDRSGSSAWFEFGFVSYANSAKTRLLGVDARLIETHGAVSREVAESMAQGARLASGADIAVAVTGIAGPDGGTADKPVGTVWLAWDSAGHGIESRCERFGGSREAVRRQTVAAALDGVLERA